MTTLKNTLGSLKTLPRTKLHFYALPELERQGIGAINRLPISIRVMLESLLRNCDGKRVREEDILRLAKWGTKASQKGEVPFVVSRVLLQDFTGVPLLVDLAAMRDAAAANGADPSIIEPQVPVDLIVDHSVQVDRAGTSDSFQYNLKLEFERNLERYAFLKWGGQAFNAFTAVPPGIGICHQINLEYLAPVVIEKKIGQQTLLYPDTLVGTDSHTTMINGLGVVGWGVGGIEAQAAMLGQPVTIQMPEVIGVHLSGKLRPGVTATDLTLRITQMLRKENVVDKFVEFYGEGAASLTVADRATIGNMAPEYGATMGFFPVDEKTLDYLKMTGREPDRVAIVKDYLVAQQLFGIPKKDEVDFTKVVSLDLSSITPCVAGPKRPQDRIDLSELRQKFQETLANPVSAGGYGKSAENSPHVKLHTDGSFSLHSEHASGGTSVLENNAATTGWSESEMVMNRPFTHVEVDPGYSDQPGHTVLTHGSVVIAAITSCTNTSNPSVMIAAGLLAKKAVEKGLRVNHAVKTSLAPGSRVVSGYLTQSGLQKYLDTLGFELVAYGCTTCIGNSGPLDESIEKAIQENDLITASVLSGNRNFEARIHSAVKANFLMSPPLVVAFALAGRVDIDLDKEPLGLDKKGKPVFLHEIWPSPEEIESNINKHVDPKSFKQSYAHILDDSPIFKKIKGIKGPRFQWEATSTYIQNPPYFENFSLQNPPRKELNNMSCLALFGDSVTTDHISPAGAFDKNSPAGKYLLSLGVKENDFNSYGSRRGNHNVMMRGTFANVRIKNKMADGKEGGFTKLIPEGTILPIFDACQTYAKKGVPLIVFAGKDYGMGSSRDWAAKGTLLLGVRAVVARSFERIHRSNLVGMGVLPLEFRDGESHESLGIQGDEMFSVLGLENKVEPGQECILEITRGNNKSRINLIARLDTPIDVEYYQQGGIMPFTLRNLLASNGNEHQQ